MNILNLYIILFLMTKFLFMKGNFIFYLVNEQTRLFFVSNEIKSWNKENRNKQFTIIDKQINFIFFKKNVE
jgi:hypothetical protein